MKTEQEIRNMAKFMQDLGSPQVGIDALKWVLEECPEPKATSDPAEAGRRG